MTIHGFDRLVKPIYKIFFRDYNAIYDDRFGSHLVGMTNGGCWLLFVCLLKMGEVSGAEEDCC